MFNHDPYWLWPLYLVYFLFVMFRFVHFFVCFAAYQLVLPNSILFSLYNLPYFFRLGNLIR